MITKQVGYKARGMDANANPGDALLTDARGGQTRRRLKSRQIQFL
jgi:hypothetical protein